MKVTHIASECAPFAKSGGLGDVVYGLSRMTNSLSCEADVIIPHYKIHAEKVSKNLFDQFSVKLDGEVFDVHVYQTIHQNIHVYTIDSSHPKNLFNRTSIYGEEDDTHRFLCFSYFALLFLQRKKISTPNLLHLHDWPTGFCSAFLKFLFPELKKEIRGTVLTIHNLKHQGITTKKHLEYFDLKESQIPKTYEQSDNPAYINIAKASIEEASHCVTVSPTYLREIQTSLCGEGLENFIQKRIQKFSAILNGIDTDYWNPEKDPYLHENYRTEAFLTNVIEAKYRNKHFLQKNLHLEISHQPLFIFITRLVDQKGPHLILEAIKQIKKRGCQCVLLGSEPTKELQEEFQKMVTPGQIYIDFRFQEGLAHLCYSAADAIIVPSIFEPCGLTQLIAMRYGTIPIVRKTGGLSDTVFDIEHSQVAKNLRTGFVFEYPTLDSMDYIVNRAVDCFNNDRATWDTLIKNSLCQNVSFEIPAKKYLQVYQSILT
jgi:starch synthase